MKTFVTVALVGLGAQLVDGTLGMAYGVTSTTLLLAAGYAPAAASAAVHLAEIGTSLASGASHWRFGNVDWGVVAKIGVPGAVGAFAGATVLSSLTTESAEPWMAGILLALGVYILLRFATKLPTLRLDSPPRKRFLTPLGLFAGFVDATGGGGWGPVATPTLISSGRMIPRKVIGTVDTSEFLVAVAASIGFVIGLGSENLAFSTVAGLLVGGVIAAPIAAYLVRHVPGRMLGSLVGGIIIVTNSRTLMEAFEITGGTRAAIYVSLFVIWAGAITVSVQGLRKDSREQRELLDGTQPEEVPAA
ncbi:MAG: sulfite exporter TauE/SafE family protein [Actinomycetes bacterium]